MEIKFLQDFRGRETNEMYYLKDTIVELPDHMADRLVADGRAEYVAHGTSNADNTPQFEEVPPAVVTPIVENVQPSRKRGRQ